MAVYVDPLLNHGWVLYGRPGLSCHLFTDGPLEELHAMAVSIGLKRRWRQGRGWQTHYDLVESKREAAIRAGARPVSMLEAVEIWRRVRCACS